MQAAEMLDRVRSIVERIGARSVYGEPVVSGDTTIVPVASVAFGFGGGSGRGKNPEDGGEGEGGGGGGGFRGWPAGYIEITPSGTRFVPVHEKQKIAAALLAGFAIGFMIGKLRRRR